jgi:hypothetical protein
MYWLKQGYFSKNAFKYNTVFFGSSRTYRHINPQIIDNELKEFNIKSFNFGMPAAVNPEALSLFEDFLENLPPKSTIHYAFVELTDLAPINKLNQYAPRSYYYLNFKYLQFVLKYFFSSKETNLISKIKLSYPYVQGYFLNNFLLTKPVKNRAIGKKYLGENKDGYYALDIDLKKNKSNKLLDRHLTYLKDISLLKTKITSRKSKNASSSVNHAYLRFLKAMIKKSEDKNVKLYLIIPPRLNNYAMLYPFKKCINDDRVIDLSNNPEFYLAEFTFDEFHLNSSGADIFSAFLSKEIKLRLGADR